MLSHFTDDRERQSHGIMTPTVLSPNTTRHQVLMCVRKLSESQLNLAHGTQQKSNEKLQPKTDTLRITVPVNSQSSGRHSLL